MSDQKQISVESVEEEKKLIVSVSAISFNFDYVSSDPDKLRADEIKVLLPKNKKPPRGSGELKPPGFGTPTGQVESRETILGALERETKRETGYPVAKVIGKAFMVYKHWVPNEIHVFLIENYDYNVGVQERDEIDYSIDPWHSLHEVFSMPTAQGKKGEDRNPDGIYFSHRSRIFRFLETALRHPQDLIDGDKIAKWIKPHRNILMSAMQELEEAGLLEELHDSYTHYEKDGEDDKEI